MLDAGTWRPEYEALLPLIDYLVVGVGFAFGFLNTRDPEEALQELTTYGARLVCITLGEQGCIAAANGVLFPSARLSSDPLVDTTGCGDAFHGGLIFALLQGWKTPTCLAFASAVASLKCRRLGGRAALPTLAEALAVVPARLRPPRIGRHECPTRSCRWLMRQA
jgi:sulfofructose kinase